jgi:hypothetical protein
MWAIAAFAAKVTARLLREDCGQARAGDAPNAKIL